MSIVKHIIDQFPEGAVSLCEDLRTPLMLAAAEGIIPIITVLLTATRDTEYIHQKDLMGNTAVHYAAWFGHLLCVQYLIEKCGGNALMKNNEGMPPVHFAAAGNHSLIVEYLMGLETATGPLSLSSTGLNNLHRACMHGSLEAVEAMVSKHSFDVSAKSVQNGNTALHFATLGGFKLVIKYLVTVGASVNAHNDLGLTALHLACIG